MPKIKVFVGEHCPSCQPVKDFVKSGKLKGEIEIIDVETEEGFPYIEKMNLEIIPSVYADDKKCQIEYDEKGENVIDIICP